ncbi:unnamed protein product [Psylliodes chrysocephalus]|uniref:Uncharacterized protein n=1 Tax=Psylliodes chrysocephalus TaxID=3402493 RepID=A0A9P0CDA1_9CUCU|nr:unnamed protein product [Psylliodes chrysocephala]
MSSQVFNSRILIFGLLFLLFCCTDSWNFTENLLRFKKDSFSTKSGRLISFDASDGNLKVDLEFSIPFLEVPVQKSVDYARNFVAKINVPSLVLSGVVIFVSAVVIPTVFMFWNKKFHILDPPTNSYRKIEEEPSILWRYLTYLDAVFMENDIDTTSCLQRSICSLINKSKQDNLNGNGSSMNKIIDGVSSSDWFLEQVFNTPLYSAIIHGTKNGKCSEQFTNCRITQKTFNKFAREIFKYVGTGT